MSPSPRSEPRSEPGSTSGSEPRSSSSGQLETRVGYVLKQVDALLRTRMDDELRPLALTVPQYACLELIDEHPGLSNADLARRAFVSPQAMHQVVRTLQDRGLVSRPGTVPSGRRLPVELTPAGRSLVTRASDRIRAVERRLTDGLTADQTATLLASLRDCARRLGAEVERA